MKFVLPVISALSAATLLIPFSASAYTQDPRSCSDPRTQYPSNPPCQKQSPFANFYNNGQSHSQDAKVEHTQR